MAWLVRVAVVLIAMVLMASPMARAQTGPSGHESEEVAEVEDDETSAFDRLQGRMFVDGYYMKDWSMPSGDQNVTATVPHRAFDQTNGFALSFIGLDLDYQDDELGATVNLRFGPSVPRLLIGAPPARDLALESVKQAFVSWRPTEGLQLDLGQFDTIYGAEVSESFANLNYTRGALYYLMQPFYHTGIRANYAASDQLTITGLLVNGTNSHFDADELPDLGVQLTFAASSDVSLVGGYILTTIENAMSGKTDVSHLFDVIAKASVGDLALVLNGDVGLNAPHDGDGTLFWGASLAASYALADCFDVAVRGELLGNPDAVFYGKELTLITGTLTLGVQPIPGHENLLIRLEGRIEHASSELFPDGGTVAMPGPELSKLWASAVLGVVVTTE